MHALIGSGNSFFCEMKVVYSFKYMPHISESKPNCIVLSNLHHLNWCDTSQIEHKKVQKIYDHENVNPFLPVI